MIGRRFDLRRQAVQWAEEERKHLENKQRVIDFLSEHVGGLVILLLIVLVIWASR